MKQTPHDRSASVVWVRAVSEAVKPRSMDYEASSSVQTGYSLLHEMLQWGGNVGSFCDPARDICLTSFTIMGRRGRPSPPPHHLPSPHHPTTASRRAEPSKQSRANLFIFRHVCFCIWASVYVCYGIHTCVHIHTRAPLVFLFFPWHISLLFQTYTLLYYIISFRFLFISCEEW